MVRDEMDRVAHLVRSSSYLCIYLALLVGIQVI